MAKYDELSNKIENIENQLKTTDGFNPIKHTSETRSKIANRFVIFFFGVIGGGVIVILIYNAIVYFNWDRDSQNNIKDYMIDLQATLPILISAVSSPLGFVVGYYFKTESKQDK